jgi:hypothetical protein
MLPKTHVATRKSVPSGAAGLPFRRTYRV